MQRRNVLLPGLAVLLVLPFGAGCRTASHATNGAAIGAGLGTVAGAVIGHQSGHGEGGALIGAATGALAGSILGNAEDAREERDAAIAHAQYVEATSQALTNADLTRMAQNGLSDDVIINSVQTRGGRFDLSPDALISLRSYGVSDRVLLSLQNSAAVRPVVTGTTQVTHYVVTPRVHSAVVIGRPHRPTVIRHRHW